MKWTHGLRARVRLLFREAAEALPRAPAGAGAAFVVRDLRRTGVGFLSIGRPFWLPKFAPVIPAQSE